MCGMNSIGFCGNIIVDSIKTISTWPDQGMLATISSVRRAVGGVVCNNGIDMKTLDPSVTVRGFGRIGDDDNGAYARACMERVGMDCRGVVKVPGVPTTFTDVMCVESTGARTFFNMHGADSRLTPEDIDPATLGVDLFHFGYLLLLDGMDAEDAEYGTKAARLLAKVQAAGIKTSIDIVSEQSERFARVVRHALRYCDYAIVNEVEGSRATGVPEADLRGICEKFFELGVREQVVIHKPEVGVSLKKDGSWDAVGSLILPEGWIKGAAGAGDAFCTGMLYAILKDLPAEQGLRLGSAMSALNLTVLDGTSGAKGLEETLALDRRFSRRDVVGQ